MAIKAFISRKFKPDSLKEAVELLTRTRYGAMRMKGYISSETLHRISDPVEVVVVSMWQTLEDWERWRTSPQRSEFAAKAIIASSVSSRVFMQRYATVNQPSAAHRG